jgi:hypothetical protein
MISLALLLAVATPDLDHANEEARKVLEKSQVAFCHDPKYPLTDTEAGWCPPVGPEKFSRCPAFPSACKAPRALLDSPSRLDFSRGRDKDPDEKDRKPDEKSPTVDEEPDEKTSGMRKEPTRRVLEEEDPFELPPLGGLGYYLFWTVLAAGLLFLLYLIIRNSTRNKSDEPDAVTPPDDDLAPAATNNAAHEQLVRDVDALLEQARAAASAGDYARAIQRTHAALLHRLDHDGLIRVAPFRTNGDYVRDLQPEADLRREVREIVRDVEQVQFGTTPPSASLYDRVRGRVIPIATRRSAALLALLTFNLLSCDEKNYPFDQSPSGADPVVQLAAVYDIKIKFRLEALADIDPSEDLGDDNQGRTLVLLHDAPFPTPDEWARLLEWAEHGHHLVVAGREPPTDLGISVESNVPNHDLKVSPEFVDALGELDLITADDDYLLPTRTDGRNLLEFAPGLPYAIQYERGFRGGDVTVFADDRLFTAGGLMLRDNPEFLIRFLRELGPREVEFADGLLELGADTPAEAIANTHLTPVILQLLALLAIFYFCRGVRFGRPHDPPTRSRRQFAEHVEALGHQYARARASRHAVRLYAAWAVDRLREKTLTTRTPGIYPLAQAIAGRTGDDENRVMETLVEASSLRDTTTLPATGTPASAEDLRLMQDLARLVRLVGGPR